MTAAKRWNAGCLCLLLAALGCSSPPEETPARAAAPVPAAPAELARGLVRVSRPAVTADDLAKVRALVARLEQGPEARREAAAALVALDWKAVPVLEEVRWSAEWPLTMFVDEVLAEMPLSAWARDGEVLREKDGMPMAWVPPGEIPLPEWLLQPGSPPRPIRIDGFFIDRFCVTNRMMVKYLNEARITYDGNRNLAWVEPQDGHWVSFRDGRWVFEKGFGNHPAWQLMYHQWLGYAAWAGALPPTGSQWERAAGAADGRWYPWGNEACTPRMCQTDRSPLEGTVPVWWFPQSDSPFGLRQMTGNVLHYTLDSVDLDYPPLVVWDESGGNPIAFGTIDERHVLEKGGGYDGESDDSLPLRGFTTRCGWCYGTPRGMRLAMGHERHLERALAKVLARPLWDKHDRMAWRWAALLREWLAPDSPCTPDLSLLRDSNREIAWAAFRCGESFPPPAPDRLQIRRGLVLDEGLPFAFWAREAGRSGLQEFIPLLAERWGNLDDPGWFETCRALIRLARPEAGHPSLEILDSLTWEWFRYVASWTEKEALAKLADGLYGAGIPRGYRRLCANLAVFLRDPRGLEDAVAECPEILRNGGRGDARAAFREWCAAMDLAGSDEVWGKLEASLKAGLVSEDEIAAEMAALVRGKRQFLALVGFPPSDAWEPEGLFEGMSEAERKDWFRLGARTLRTLLSANGLEEKPGARLERGRRGKRPHPVVEAYGLLDADAFVSTLVEWLSVRHGKVRVPYELQEDEWDWLAPRIRDPRPLVKILGSECAPAREVAYEILLRRDDPEADAALWDVVDEYAHRPKNEDGGVSSFPYGNAREEVGRRMARTGRFPGTEFLLEHCGSWPDGPECWEDPLFRSGSPEWPKPDPRGRPSAGLAWAFAGPRRGEILAELERTWRPPEGPPEYECPGRASLLRALMWARHPGWEDRMAEILESKEGGPEGVQFGMLEAGVRAPVETRLGQAIEKRLRMPPAEPPDEWDRRIQSAYERIVLDRSGSGRGVRFEPVDPAALDFFAERRGTLKELQAAAEGDGRSSWPALGWLAQIACRPEPEARDYLETRPPNGGDFPEAVDFLARLDVRRGLAMADRALDASPDEILPADSNRAALLAFLRHDPARGAARVRGLMASLPDRAAYPEAVQLLLKDPKAADVRGVVRMADDFAEPPVLWSFLAEFPAESDEALARELRACPLNEDGEYGRFCEALAVLATRAGGAKSLAALGDLARAQAARTDSSKGAIAGCEGTLARILAR